MLSTSTSAPETKTTERRGDPPNRAVKKLANCSSHQEDCDDHRNEDDLFGAGSLSPADVDRGVVEDQG